MKRPYLVHCNVIDNGEQLSIKAAVTIEEYGPSITKDFNRLTPSSPWQGIKLMGSNRARLKIVGISEDDLEIYEHEFESDAFGNFNIRIPQKKDNRVRKLRIFETSFNPGLELLVGSFIALDITDNRKILITDFDKTLVDTRYSTLSEVYESLRYPLEHFPPVQKSIDKVKSFIDSGFHPFVVSASPHFYEKAMRDWLYHHEIFTSHIFLKDYRKIFSLDEGDLRPKDLKSHGFYKLDNLVNILLMTSLPKELVLIGDGFESDIIIYLTLYAALKRHIDPWQLWNQVKSLESFRLTNKQNSRFLSKFYRIHSMIKQGDVDIQIHIRCKEHDYDAIRNRKIPINALEELRHKVQYYIA